MKSNLSVDKQIALKCKGKHIVVKVGKKRFVAIYHKYYPEQDSPHQCLIFNASPFKLKIDKILLTKNEFKLFESMKDLTDNW